MGSVISKLDNSRLLRRHKTIGPYIPETLPLSQASLSPMLRQFPFVYLKPDNSCQGKGILRIDPLPSGEFLLRTRDTGSESVHFHLPHLWEAIHQAKIDRPYIIQQGINSVTLTGHLFDIRVHLMRIKGKWRVAGIVGRVAPKKSIVTNAYSGGISKHVDRLLTDDLGYNPRRAEHTIEELCTISKQATKIISRVYPRWSEFGLDIGIDPFHRIWIYEINIKPGTLVFKNLDRETFRHILKLRKKAS
ncbi:YheC/YheD family protein [Lihuaxuella thermophila]|uniref:YheC/D like ATP-grasp n=1 Tax=Lihuaxuella thermophila TaxID=1173111 RepID=A0A1H8CB35_9BACL|nr:YheC/YheD family protein [Lihuaxuella thermophila]SEM92303.1 YheC/D like ATP-grasp [Lihuaxuella thermophila]